MAKIYFVDNNYPGVVYFGSLGAMNHIENEGGSVVEITQPRAERILREGIEYDDGEIVNYKLDLCAWYED